MSLTDPDARGRALRPKLGPVAVVVAAIGLGSAPVIAYLLSTSRSPDDLAGPAILTYVILSTAAGVFINYAPHGREALLVAAYWVAYGGGLTLILGSTTPISDESGIPQSAIPALVLYLVAATLLWLYLLKVAAVRETTAHGVDTIGTVTYAAVNGFVNFVQHQRLTIKFTDREGLDRWVKIGRTGGGYSVGDTVPVRYDPERPGLKRAIIVG